MRMQAALRIPRKYDGVLILIPRSATYETRRIAVYFVSIDRETYFSLVILRQAT